MGRLHSFLLAAVLLAGCSASGDRAAPPADATPTQESTPTAAPTAQRPPPPSTGIALVDAAAKAVVAGDIDGLMNLFAPEIVPCFNKSEEGFAGPGCEPEEAQGTLVPTVWRSACSGDRVRPSSPKLRTELTRILAMGLELEAVVRTPSPDRYIAVFSLPVWDGSFPRWFSLSINDRGITAVIPGCPTWTEFPPEWGVEDIYRRGTTK